MYDSMVNKNGVTTPRYGFMHLYWSQISREMRLVAVMMMIINNARSPWILADYQDRLPDDEMHVCLQSLQGICKAPFFCNYKGLQMRTCTIRSNPGAFVPDFCLLISIIVLISTSQALASQISEQLCQVLTGVAVATQKSGGF